MSGLSIIVAAFLLALVAMSFAFGGGAVVVALPVAVIGIVVIGFLDFNRRRKQTQQLGELRDQAKADQVEFTERDKETLASSD
jgi:UDP-N-acetylmuramyl pentapeptide phosphotransferase/UDP-N-acetylglucosamine-1-phosphate transferase